jgi:tetratricopeptide (TPR) repeat protein
MEVTTMFKRVLSVCLVLSSLLFSGIAAECFADATAELNQAETYVQDGSYDQAEAAYKAVVASYPGTDSALQAQKKLIMLYMHDQPKATTAFQDLTTNFSTDPNLPEVVYEIAEYYRYTVSNNRYEMTKLFYQYFVDTWPQHSLAMWAQAGLAASHTCLGDMTTTRTIVERVIVDFSNSPEVEKAAYDVAHQYNRFGRYTEAKQLYQYVISNWPEAKHALWKQVDNAHSSVTDGNDSAVQAAVDVLKSNLSTREFVATALFDIAEHYGKLGRHDKARTLYKYVADNHRRDDVRTLWSQMRFIMSSISLGDETAAQADMSQLLANFSNHSRLADAVCAVAEHYDNLGKYEKARQYYRYISDTWPKHEHYGLWSQIDVAWTDIALGDNTEAAQLVDALVAKLNAGFPAYAYWPAVAGEAYWLAAESYCRLAQYEKAIECCEKVINDHPEHRRTWNALSTVGSTCQILKNAGAISEAEADAKITSAYEQLLEKYPDCPAAEDAADWIEHHNSK